MLARLAFILAFILSVVSLAPAAAWACGGFFCNSATPVTQAAERILFARDGDQIEMHVQITYSGPAVDFGWILPTSADVETEVSTNSLFTRLDQRFTPQFNLIIEYTPGCEAIEEDFATGGMGAPPPSPVPDGPQVNVLSREVVGPFDRVILQADDVEVLFEWLRENEFQIPQAAAAALEPYIETSVFVAIKLLPGNDSNDIRPLRLRFTAPTPAIPLRPTQVAADPDMGIIVYLLGPGRAVATNYRHVEVNEGAIRWERGGDNYIDVVSQAVDEAGGQAFVTDYAGEHANRTEELFTLKLDLDDLRAVRTLAGLVQFASELRSPDLLDMVRAVISPPEGVDVDEVLRCPFCYEADAIAVDGEALAARIEDELLPMWEALTALLAQHRVLTRLYSTMSPAEMTVDPAFDFNADLGFIDNVHRAVMRLGCDEDGRPDYDNATITTPTGLLYLPDSEGAIERQAGETVRGMDTMGAASIEQQFVAGQSEVEVDNRAALEALYGVAGPPGGGLGGAMEQGSPGGSPGEATGGGADTGAGCGCRASDDAPATGLFLGLLLLGGLTRRRRR
jgi:MYXO-CTERM domain-containing protein